MCIFSLCCVQFFLELLHLGMYIYPVILLFFFVNVQPFSCQLLVRLMENMSMFVVVVVLLENIEEQ